MAVDQRGYVLEATIKTGEIINYSRLSFLHSSVDLTASKEYLQMGFMDFAVLGLIFHILSRC